MVVGNQSLVDIGGLSLRKAALLMAAVGHVKRQSEGGGDSE